MHRSFLGLSALAFVLAACGDGGDIPRGEGVFVEGCPQAGQSHAMEIKNPAQKMTGPEVLGGVGDYLLMNDRAAFIVRGPGERRTYYYYSGILVDAVAVDGCRQLGKEQFSEFGPLFGQLNLGDFGQSMLRAFKGELFEVLNDGSDGKAAIVRVHGTNDRYWLVEMEILRAAIKSGDQKKLSDPYEVKLSLDYVLEPGSRVLEIRLNFENLLDREQSFMGGATSMVANSTPPRAFSSSKQNIAGFDVRLGIPWFVAGSGTGSYAMAIDSPVVGTMQTSGMDALIDIDQIASPLRLAPAGQDGSKQTMRYFVAVGPSDANSAVRELMAYEENGAGMPMEPISGSVQDAVNGAPIADIDVELQRRSSGGEWFPMDAFRTDGEGHFSGAVADFDDTAPSYRLVVAIPGRPVLITQPFDALSIPAMELVVSPSGTLAARITDDESRPLTAKLQLRRNGEGTRTLYPVDGTGDIPVPPGEYEVTVTRGYEYGTWSGTVEIKAQQSTELRVELPHHVDTTGFLSFDGHVHGEPSIDSRLPVETRLHSVIGEGIDVFAATDHEVIVDYRPRLEAAGLKGKVAVVLGQEVTATIPEHTNMYPVPPDPSHVRGSPVQWEGRDFGQIWAAQKARGAGISQLNHPRNGCSWMCLIKWNRLTGEADVTGPTTVGLSEGQQVWSWDFDAIEYMNGLQRVTLDPEHPDSTGLLDDWMAFHNLGHRITAVGVSDVHSEDMVGDARTYFASPTDDPGQFQESYLVDAIKNGRVVVSGGAFARVKVNATAGLGDTITDTDGTVDLHVRVEAMPEVDVTHVAVLSNCDQVVKVAATDPNGVVKLDRALQIPVTRDSHLVVLAFGRYRLPAGFASGDDPQHVPRVTTNPIFIDYDGNGKFDPPGGKTCQYDFSPPALE